MTRITAREFAVNVTRQLQLAGFEAFWAGGCVRDQLLGQSPKDYDIATNATPEQIRALFGKNRTLAIGQSFGVITVLGPKSAGQIEVATFREDAAYSDGRHPDAIKFSDAENDALRRDFTINGMYYDPIRQQVVDYVGGREDLKKKVIRAIGDPYERISEDKLRMLRGIRFASTFQFDLDQATLDAIKNQSSQIQRVSAERISNEIRQMFSDDNRAQSLKLLLESGLLVEILPEAEILNQQIEVAQKLSQMLPQLPFPKFESTLAVVLHCVRGEDKADAYELSRNVADRWRLSNQERNEISWLVRTIPIWPVAIEMEWPIVQSELIGPLAAQSVAIARLIAENESENIKNQAVINSIEFCEAKLALAPTELNPPELLSGNDLLQLGIRPGPDYGRILREIRIAQLNAAITTRDEAIEFAKSIA